MSRIKNWKKTTTRAGRYEWTNTISGNKIRVSQASTGFGSWRHWKNVRKPWITEFLTKDGLKIKDITWGYAPREDAMANAQIFMKNNPFGIGSL
jgi:hypothetical protein